MPRDIFHSHRTPAPSRFARREPISESCVRALRAASTGRLLGPARGRQSGYTEGYPQFQACHGQLVAHGATITALLKRKAIALDLEAGVYRLTVVGVEALRHGSW